jgi:septation ring formation regulator EzrA
MTTAIFSAATELRKLVKQYRKFQTQAADSRTKRAALETELADYKKKIDPSSDLSEIEKQLAVIAPRQMQYELLPRYIEKTEEQAGQLTESIRKEVLQVREAINSTCREELATLARLGEKALKGVPELGFVDTKNPETQEVSNPALALAWRSPAIAKIGGRVVLRQELQYLQTRSANSDEAERFDAWALEGAKEILAIVDKWEKAGGSFRGNVWES